MSSEPDLTYSKRRLVKRGLSPGPSRLNSSSSSNREGDEKKMTDEQDNLLSGENTIKPLRDIPEPMTSHLTHKSDNTVHAGDSSKEHSPDGSVSDVMGFTEKVMAEEGHEHQELNLMDELGDGIRERLVSVLHAQRLKKTKKQKKKKPIFETMENASEMYLMRSNTTHSLKEDLEDKMSNWESEGSQHSVGSLMRRGSLVDGFDEETEKKISSSLLMNIFSPPMIEQFLLQDRPYPETQDVEIELIDTIEFSFKPDSHELVVEKRSLPLSFLKKYLNSHSNEVQKDNSDRRKKTTSEAQSAIPLGTHWGMDDDGKKLYRSRMEINSYPLDVRLRVIGEDNKILNNVRKRLGLFKVTQEGTVALGHTYFLNFDGYSQRNCDLAVDEVTSILESYVEDYAQEVDLHDLMQLLLAIGSNSPPSTLTLRHCVLMGLYPIQSVITWDRMILIESRSLAKSKNQILEATADEVAKAFRYIIEHKRVNKKTQKKTVYFDQVCYEAIFMTIWKIHVNALASVQSRALVCHRVYNAKAYVSLEDQKQMYLVKVQASKLKTTVSSMIKTFKEILAHDVQMAFMNLHRLKENNSIYRMTVDKKKTLSSFDDRITAASHDIELILYAHFLRYAKLEKEAEGVIDMLGNVEEWQTLQSLNTQTKVLVANTYMTMLGCTVAFGGAITGAFGMNLDNAYVDWPNYSFYLVCFCVLLFVVLGTHWGIYMLQKNGVIPRDTLTTTKQALVTGT
jgi:hypothetical protein